jgi:hypothetical protein
MAWEAEDFWRSSGVFACRPSASFNDNLVDISLLQELAAYGIEAGTPERAATQPIAVRPADVEQAAHPGDLAYDLHHPNRRRNLDNHDVAIDQADLDRYDGTIPHIRDPRSQRNRDKG